MPTSSSEELCRLYCYSNRLGVTLVLLQSAQLSCGCSGSKHPTVPVQGVVQVDGNAPPGPGMIVFTPICAGAATTFRPGTASFDESGRFQAHTFGKADGLLPGDYYLSVECWEIPPSMDGPPAKSHIDTKYNTAKTSELTVSVDPDHRGAAQLDLDLTGAK